ncbi:hypothetical protein GW7_13505 [Heterocephalus glaber]|uniref:FYN-binding protein 2 n=1 Tax=Heterocephalus glaber TaxID=10181 RepID=G5APP7_HETGA|nr:hypothetical protein GW7_13505 [Heterocephalus glaber]
MKLTQRSKIQKSPSFPGLLENPAVCSPRNSQEASLLLDVNRSNTEMTSEEKGTVANSFQDKLRKWEKVSSQKSVTFSALLLTNGGGKAFHPEEEKSTKLLPHRPREKIQTKWALTLPSKKELAQRKALATCEQPPSPCSQAGEKNQEKPSVEGNSAGGPCQPVYECELAIPAPANPPDTQHRQLPRTKPLPPVGSLGPAPPKPLKPPAVDLQAFQRQPAALSKAQYKGHLLPLRVLHWIDWESIQEEENTKSLSTEPVGLGAPCKACVVNTIMQDKGADMKESLCPLESAEFEEPHNYEATISYLRHLGNSINLCTAEEIANSTYDVGIEELQKPWKSFLHQELRPKREDEDKHMKEKDPCGLEHQNSEQDPHSKHPFKVDVYEVTPEDIQMTTSHGDRWSTVARQQETMTDEIEAKACPEDMDLVRPSQGQGVESLELTTHTQDLVAFKSCSGLQATYDDVDCPVTDISKSDFSSSFTSDSEESSEEMYEDVYKTKSNSSPIDHEDKMKTWRPNFLTPRRKKEKNRVEGSESFFPRNFFRIKKQNSLEKNRVREEKLFRQRFQYDKEITVINRAVVCSSNSRNGIFDLPITPGEELEVIDTTDQNLVICRNSKGKYGYVLIEHLDFKHQGWSH